MWERVLVLLSLVLKVHEHFPYLQHHPYKSVTIKNLEKSLIEIDGEIVSLDEVTLIPQKRYIYL